jgi:hypothetical protein
MTAARRRSRTAIAAATAAVAVAAGLAACTSPEADDPRGPGTGQRADGDAARARASSAPSSAARSGSGHDGLAPRRIASVFRLRPAHGRGHLTAWSHPRALPASVLIADEGNNRLLLVDPRGRVRWVFPRPGGGFFGPPDDAFISPDGRAIIATQEIYDRVTVLDIARRQVLRRYGHPGTPGSAPGYFSHPDDAMLLPGGDVLLADIINCRILILAPGRWHVLRQLGSPAACGHHPPAAFGSPNGVFPLRNGHFLVTEINGDWVDAMNLRGRVFWSARPPGVAYPSDANEMSPGRYLVADYSYPGQVVIFDRAGRALWRFRPRGRRPLNHPSLALPLPNGNILVNDDYNHRVIVIDYRTKRIIWQYGHYGVPGRSPGYLNNPDGVDVAPPFSLLITHRPPRGP